jgi:hypothetical protein
VTHRTWTVRRRRLLSALVLSLALAGCKEPGLTEDSYVATGPGDVDMLWILDNSASMSDAQSQLRDSFGEFVAGLPPGSGTQLGITSTQAWPCTEDISSLGCNDRKGSTGRVVYDDGAPALLDPSDPFDQELFTDLSDVGIHGAGYERGLQVALLAACEASTLPTVTDFIDGVDDLKWDFPSGCSGDAWDPTHPLYEACHCLPQQIDMEIDGQITEVSLHGANQGLLRGNPLHTVIVTDEGDTSRDLHPLREAVCDVEPEEICGCMHAELLRLLRSVAGEVRISVIGPGQGPSADEEMRYACNPMQNDPCPLDFHFWSTEETAGTFVPILEPADDYDPLTPPESCDEAGFADAMAELVMIHPSTEWFALSEAPDNATLEVERNGEPVPAKVEGSGCSDAVYGGGGWNYEPDLQAVALLGDCTPYPPDVVTIRYEPLTVVQP